MVGKNKIKLINSLKQKKQRIKNALFIAEGIKTVNELLRSSFELEMIFSTEPILEAPNEKFISVSDQELKKISQLTTPQTVLALFKIPAQKPISPNGLILALDGIRDPGNLGTIIRLCDWFGISNLICSKDTVDCYSPKVIQASMGSIARINLVYLHLENYLKNTTKPIYGTFLSGENIYAAEFSNDGILVLGNEANGISAQIEKLATTKLSIPQFGETKTTESLNVATATAICLSEFRRPKS